MNPGDRLHPAVFVDRDGTLMEDVPYLRDPEKIRLFPGVIDSILALKNAGYAVVMITNQSGIGRGWMTIAEHEAVQRRFCELLGNVGLDAIYYCPDAPNVPSTRRKPEPGMVLEAAHELRLDLGQSWFIGDKEADVQCAIRAGVKPVQVATGEGRAQRSNEALFFAESFSDAADFILSGAQQR